MKRETVREFVFYEYAKLITNKAKGPRPPRVADRREKGRYWSFVAMTFKKLKDGKLSPSGLDKENKMLVEGDRVCAYCGCEGKLQWEHIIPRSRGGPDTIDNQVLACGECNRAKGTKDPIEWLSPDRIEIPRLVMGKFLKLVLEKNLERGTFDELLQRHPDGRENWCGAFEEEQEEVRRRQTCPFCQLEQDKIVAQDELTLTMRDGYPVSEGHTLVIPKRHVESWFDLEDDEQTAMLRAVRKAQAALDDELHPAGWNFGINVGAAAGQTVWHVHVHLIPRYDNDVDDPRGGVRHVIPGKGFY